MKKVLSLLLSAVIVTSCLTLCSAFPGESLCFPENDKFKIMVFSDTQDDQYPAYDMLNLIKKGIEESNPDLIVFTGDLVEDSRIGDLFIDDESFREGVVVKDISGNVDHDKTLENINTAVDPIFEILEESGVPYALAQGNNDHKCSITNEEWLEIYSQYPNCLVKDISPDKDGRIDYNIEIKGKDDKTEFNIWMIDSGTGGVSEEQIEWYKSESSKLTERNNGVPVPALLFQHIQTCDIGNLFEECKPWDEGAGFQDGKYYRLNRKIASGKNVITYVPGNTSDEFKAWKEQGDVIGAFFGHQHVDGFSGVYDGIELGFTYGSEMAKIGPYGYRLITLNRNDILNYSNEVYCYKGNVKIGNDHFEKQELSEYKEYDNFVSKIFAYIYNMLYSTVSIIISLVL